MRVLVWMMLLLILMAQANADAKNELYQIIDQEWQLTLESSPMFATMVGDRRFNAELAQISSQDLAKRNQARKDLLAKLNKIKEKKLNERDHTNLVMLRRKLENEIQLYEFKHYLLPINADSGFHTHLVHVVGGAQLKNIEDYEQYISRLKQFKRYVSQQIQHLREGVKIGMTIPQLVLKGYETSISAHVVENPEESIFYKSLKNFPAAVPVSEQSRLRKLVKQAINESVVPAYRSFLSFMVNEYIPAAKKSIAASDFPNGKDYYAFLVKMHTTLDVSPERVHQIGLNEVKRIRLEMQQIIDELKFDGSFSEFLHFLRTDKQFYATSADELLKEARDISKRMDAKLPSLFKVLPRTPYGVEAVPEEIAAKYTTGRYVGTTLGSTKPGYYWVNTYRLDKRPLYNLPALTLHEAVPGHHVQISLAQENRNIPNFRRFNYITAFGEGWGLYSEKLGIEAGIYRNHYERFGRLSYEMWRACRLVVDTGMHAKGWSRAQAIQFMSENTALSTHNIETEIDRYISWPGQALAYKMGELKIIDLRQKSEKALGEHFDIREFHDAVLRNGGVPLKILEQQIDRYIMHKKDLHD